MDTKQYADQVAASLTAMGMNAEVKACAPDSATPNGFFVLYTSTHYQRVPVAPSSLPGGLPHGGVSTGMVGLLVDTGMATSGLTPAECANLYAAETLRTIQNLKENTPGFDVGYYTNGVWSLMPPAPVVVPVPVPKPPMVDDPNKINIGGMGQVDRPASAGTGDGQAGTGGLTQAQIEDALTHVLLTRVTLLGNSFLAK